MIFYSKTWVHLTVPSLACEQALLFRRVKRVLGKRASDRRSREGQRKGAPRSRVLARLASLAQVGELARRLCRVKTSQALFLLNFAGFQSSRTDTKST